jgi:transcriptional regulator with XRE-family HTH domain
VKLYNMMQEKGYGTRSLAKEAGVSTATVNWLLNGKGGEPYYPGPDVRRRICKALGAKDAFSIDEFTAAIEHYKKLYEEKEKAKLNSALDGFLLYDFNQAGE